MTAYSTTVPVLGGGSRPYLSPAIRIGVQAQSCGLVTGILQPLPHCVQLLDRVSSVFLVGKGQFRALLAQIPFP